MARVKSSSIFFRQLCTLYNLHTLFFFTSPTDDHWHGKVNDSQFYENGISVIGGMQSSAPDGVQVEYMNGFDINGVNDNMDEVIQASKDFDAIVVCIGEHVYSEGKKTLSFFFLKKKRT